MLNAHPTSCLGPAPFLLWPSHLLLTCLMLMYIDSESSVWPVSIVLRVAAKHRACVCANETHRRLFSPITSVLSLKWWHGKFHYGYAHSPGSTSIDNSDFAGSAVFRYNCVIGNSLSNWPYTRIVLGMQVSLLVSGIKRRKSQETARYCTIVWNAGYQFHALCINFYNSSLDI